MVLLLFQAKCFWSQSCITGQNTPPLLGNGSLAFSWDPNQTIKVLVDQNFSSAEATQISAAFTQWQNQMSPANVAFNVVTQASISNHTDGTPITSPGAYVVQKMQPPGNPGTGQAVAGLTGRPDTTSTGRPADAWTQLSPQITNVTALLETMLHEIGHTFGLDDCTTCTLGTTVMQSNLPGGFNDTTSRPSTLQGCEVNQANQAGQYSPPPPPPPPPGDCSVYGCTCGGTCNKDGSCTYTVDCSPILIAVGKDGDIELTSSQDGVWFDIEANGKPQWVGWTQKSEPVAFLARDVNHDGRINDGSELFGNHTLLPNGKVAPNGFAALTAYDGPENGGNGDGVIDARDAIWKDLRLWIDWNHNGISEANELYRLEDWGLMQISLDYESINRADKFGNVFRFKAPCQLAGKVRFGYDVYFSARPPKKP